MRFANPAWLWALLAVPAFFALFLLDRARREKRFALFADRALWDRIAPEFDPSAGIRKGIVLSLALAFVFLALARPQWGAREENVRITGIDVVVALDLSSSMDVEDIVPSRLGKAKHLTRTLVEQLQGDRVGLVAFAGSASLASPLTTDLSYILETLDILSPSTMGTQGSLIGLGLELSRRTLDRGAENSQKDKNAPPSKAVVLISDGEEHDGSAAEAAKRLAANGARVYAIGVGTEKGGPIPSRDAQGNLFGYKRSPKGDPVVSSFRPRTLQEVAEAGGGRYWNATDQEVEIRELLDDLKGLTSGQIGERSYIVYDEHFQIPLAIALILLLLELSLPARRRAVGDLGRAAILLGGALLAAGSGTARAYPMESYSLNRQGVEAYQKGEFEEAKRKFGEAQALDPMTPEFEFNRGGAQFRQGDPKSAEGAFREAARRAREAGNIALEGRSLFNLGVAQSKGGDFKGAVESYIGAVEAARAAGDADTERAARKNIELMVQQQQQQQKQKQDQNQDKQDQQKKDEQSQQEQQKQGQGKDDPKSGEKKDEQDQQGDQEKKQKKDPNAPVEDPSQSRKRFKSKNLTAEDAERVMAELGNKERELRERLNQQKGTARRGELPDW